MAAVGIALRYGPGKGLPLASMFQATEVAGKEDKYHRTAIELTNQLLGSYEVVEVNVIAERISLVHSSLMPSLYRLVTRGGSYNDTSKLSANARRIVQLLKEKGTVTVGDTRKLLQVAGGQREDPVYAALAELQHCLLVDRGPFRMPEKGILYLPKEGYPYHFFHEAHFDLITEAEKLTMPQATDIFILKYLKGIRNEDKRLNRVAPDANLKKICSIFKLFLHPHEIAAALDRLAASKMLVLEKQGRTVLIRVN